MVLVVLIALVIQIAIAAFFAWTAEEKGHPAGRYFCACFFLSIIGYLMVAALPDRSGACASSQYDSNRSPFVNLAENEQPKPVQHPPKVDDGTTWTCACGRTHSLYVSSCPCGRSKREALQGK